MRQVAAATAATAAAALGALILGEYELTGLTALLAGPLFGLVVGELVTVVGGQGNVLLALTAAGLSAAGLAWAAWIAAGRSWGFVAPEAWVAVALGAVVAMVWVRGSGRRAAGSPHGT